MYEQADKVIKYLNRLVMREFDKLRLLDMDELNVMRTVKSVYVRTSREAKKRYRKIADDAYVYAVILGGMEPEKKLPDKWLEQFLDEPNPVTLYRFDPETERKYQRTMEALLATNISGKEVDKAIRYWTNELAQYAIDVVDQATIDGYKDAGITHVRWVTQKDEHVCETCRRRNGKIYEIGDVPPKTHWGCRCYLVPVISKTKNE